MMTRFQQTRFSEISLSFLCNCSEKLFLIQKLMPNQFSGKTRKHMVNVLKMCPKLILFLPRKIRKVTSYAKGDNLIATTFKISYFLSKKCLCFILLSVIWLTEQAVVLTSDHKVMDLNPVRGGVPVLHWIEILYYHIFLVWIWHNIETD